ncbi:hypothetical protein LAY57_29085 [Argonema antarcticum A004/B2]|nr:hypothetical protein [Argonema antarcticum A004/B2]
MNKWYKEDLAYIHHIGFRSYVLQAMPGILTILNQHGIQDGLIVDLGCGRDNEVHSLRLYPAEEIATMLHQLGFQVEAANSYGQFPLPDAHVAFVAKKPLTRN